MRTQKFFDLPSVGIMTPVAFSADECCDDGAILATGGLAVLGHVLLALFADAGSAAFAKKSQICCVTL